jgi:FAD/FMN-containing dehydrogenase
MSQEIKDKLTTIVGSGNVFDDAATLEAYSRDQSFTPARKPNYVVKVSKVEEIQDVIRYAGEIKMPVVPYSSGTDFHGGAIPVLGGILLDMSGMKQISELDTKLWSVTVAPGVTYKELQDKLAKDNLRVQVPLMAPSNSSVLASYLDREEVPGAGDFIYGNEMIQTFRMTLPSGEPFTIGNPAMPGAPHCHPMGPALNWWRLFMCGQGTMSVVNEMNLRLLPLPKEQKIFFSPFENMADGLKAIKRIQRQELGYECFLLNNFDLSCLILKESPDITDKLKDGTYVGPDGAPWWNHDMRHAFDPLRTKLPKWTLITAVSGWARLPEEKVAYQEKDLRTLAAEVGFEIKTTVGAVMGLDKIVADELILPWRLLKRFGYKGTCQSLMFKATATNLPKIEAVLNEVCARYNYSTAEVGAYIQPVERARTFDCRIDLHAWQNREADRENVKALYEEVSDAIIEAGAFFDRPYGPWADMMYRRNATYAEYLRKIKAELDPNNILNPGKLCF